MQPEEHVKLLQQEILDEEQEEPFVYKGLIWLRIVLLAINAVALVISVTSLTISIAMQQAK